MLSLAGTGLLCLTAAVQITGGLAPTGMYEVVLETDHDTARFAEYEFKGDESQFPAFLVLDRTNGNTLGRFPWPGDGSDTRTQPTGASRPWWSVGSSWPRRE